MLHIANISTLCNSCIISIKYTKKSNDRITAVRKLLFSAFLLWDTMHEVDWSNLLEILSQSVGHPGIFGILQILPLFAYCILHATLWPSQNILLVQWAL